MTKTIASTHPNFRPCDLEQKLPVFIPCDSRCEYLLLFFIKYIYQIYIMVLFCVVGLEKSRLKHENTTNLHMG